MSTFAAILSIVVSILKIFQKPDSEKSQAQKDVTHTEIDEAVDESQKSGNTADLQKEIGKLL